MKLVSPSEFAEICGVSRAAVHQAAKRGVFEIIGKGRNAKIDMLSKLAVDYINASSDRQEAKGGKKKSTAVGISGTREETRTDQVIDLDSSEIDLENLSVESAKKLKTLEEIRTKRQARLAARNELVQREFVRRLFAKLYTIDVNEQLTVGDKLAPDIAAICKIDDPATIIKINEAIEKEMYKVLGHRKRLINEFLKEIKAEGLEN